jgi:hypothetical protein
MASAVQRKSWLPILPDGESGSLARRVDEALDGLAEALAPAGSQPAFHGATDLADGPVGVALFFHYLDQARPGKGYDDQALAYLEAAIESTAEGVSSPGLYNGFPGIAWALEHLTEPGEVDAGAEVAGTLAAHLRHQPRYDGYDLFSGLAGLGVWALERSPRPGAEEVAESVVRLLGHHAERQAHGIAWRTPPERLIPAERAVWPQGCFKIGVAHGIAGVIGMLAGVPSREARDLLEGAVEWLLAQRLPPGAGSRFPGPVAPGGEPVPDPRLAWCHGDLGVAVALLAAARTAGEPEWERQALIAARAAATRPRDQGGVYDGGLCHGAAGLAHLYNRLFQATGDPFFRGEAIAWIERLLAQREPGQGVAGWLGWQAVDETADPDLKTGWIRKPVPGLLTGAAGIGLALLAAASPVEPSWDRALLCSVPPDVPAEVPPCSWFPATSVTPGNHPGKGDRS